MLENSKRHLIKVQHQKFDIVITLGFNLGYYRQHRTTFDANTARYRLTELINEKIAVGTRSAGMGALVGADLHVCPIDTDGYTLVAHTGAPLPTAARNAGLGDAAMGEPTVRLSTNVIVISLYDIVIYSSTPANSGTTTNPTGVHGKFEFRVTPFESRVSAYSSGTITASPVSNEEVAGQARNDVRGWVYNGVLYVSGLQPGAQWSIYNLSGVLKSYSTSTQEVKQLSKVGEWLKSGQSFLTIVDMRAVLK